MTFKMGGLPLPRRQRGSYTGKKIEVFKSREIEGRAKRLKFKRNTLGECFICVVTDATAAMCESRGSASTVGMGFGLKHFLNLSDGSVVESPRFW